MTCNPIESKTRQFSVLGDNLVTVEIWLKYVQY